MIAERSLTSSKTQKMGTKRSPNAVKQPPASDRHSKVVALTSPEFAAMQAISNARVKLSVYEEDLPRLLEELRSLGDQVVAGDLSKAERMLAAQAITLQSLFTRLTIRGLEQTHMSNIEGFTRLALRAQNQCRATLETLAVIKNPPVVYARQANVAVGGPQQVNNHLAHPETKIGQNQLLETSNGSWLDSGAPQASVRAN